MSRDMQPPGGRDRGPEDRRWARIAADAPVVLSRVEGESFAAEQYRNLAFQVEQRKQQLEDRSLVVVTSSPDPGAGKTLTALNLALTLAREGEQRVLLVEGDLWKPTLSTYLELDPKTPGLTQVLGGGSTVAEAASTVWGTELDVILAGETGPTTGLMAQRRLAKAVGEMRSAYEIIIVDSPPIMLASGRALAACADSVLTIIRAGQTKRRGIEEALSILGPEKVLGFVLNGARLTSEQGYAYYTGYTRASNQVHGMADAGRRRWWRIGGAVATAVASVAVGFWLLRSSAEEAPLLPEPTAAELLDQAPAEVPPMSAPVTETRAGVGPIADLLEGARTAAGTVRNYDVSYVELGFPGGDPGVDRGTAADLVIRGFRQAGLDLQQEIHEDLLSSPDAYGATEPDTNIDHRRVRNLMTWFDRNGTRLPAGADADWQPGDLVFWSTDKPGWPNHVGVVSDRRAESGRWMVIHHFKASATGAEEDALTRWPVEGRFRWDGPPGG